MRDPFDTSPVLRLGEVKAVTPEPEVPAPVTVAVENARPYSFHDVSIYLGGMELTPVTDEEIKIVVDDRIDLFTAAFAPRIDHGDTSPETMRANHAALVAKKDPQK